MRAAVLLYHSNNVSRNDYAGNDHIALMQDLRLLAELHIPVVSLHRLVDAFDGKVEVPPICVALSFDDGSWFDWHDLAHPTLGPQRSFANIMFDARTARPDVPLHATSFVIVSPAAREELDRTSLIGQGWWGEDWWQAALDSGLMAIESHSFDHHHDLIAATATGLPGGDFQAVDHYAAADAEIRQACDYLDARLPSRQTRLFAFPYGHANDYLIHDYLPNHRAEHRLAAAFTTEPKPVSRGENRWALGRYVCGEHWRSEDELRALLRDALHG